MYNSVDNCCLFDTYRQLNRQLIQRVVYLAGFPEPVGTGPVRPVPGPTGPARFEN
jgi:hypothetical protein